MWLRTAIIFLIYIFIVLMISTGASAEAQSSKEELLQAELELARKPHIYFMLNLKDKKMYFKARGLLLKEIPVDDIKFWGNMLAVKPYTMTKKSSFSTPMRDTINPQESDREEIKKEEKKDKKEKFQLKALELSDMPPSYTLSLDDNVFISVKPAGKSMVSKFYSAAYTLNWYVSRPLSTVWSAVRKKPYTAIQLRLKEEDAQALYWSFIEGGKIIIY